MTHVVVPQWKVETPQPRPLTDGEIRTMLADIESVLEILASKLLAGEHDLDSKLVVLHGTSIALRDGDKVKVTITKSKSK